VTIFLLFPRDQAVPLKKEQMERAANRCVLERIQATVLARTGEFVVAGAYPMTGT